MSLANLVGLLSSRGTGRIRVSLFTIIVLVLFSGTAPTRPVAAQEDDENAIELDSLSEEEQRQVQIAERFLTVLQRSPRRGTALDRIYGHHVEFGSLDAFLQQLHKRVADKPTDGVGWMLLGMFESQRGADASAVDALRKAEEHLPDDALASYYLGQSLLLIGQPEEAVLAFERAIDRKPRRADMLEIFRQLGRVHQRAQRADEALEVWERLEALFPDDPRVQEQIAVTLVEEGEYKLALPRYEKLATMVRDDYRRTVFQIEAAELKIRDGKKDEGLADFEKLLSNLNPTGWLHRDVRRRIEEVYLRTGDQDGLVKYYEDWVERNKEDVGAMARLAKFLASAARVPEATEWMEKALKLAPSRTDLRKAFIDQLVDDQRYAEASKQYEQLVKSAPGNQDFLRDWGRLVMRDKSVALETRKATATTIWNQIVTARPDDALTSAQVADLFRQSNIEDKALELYRKAIELSPIDPQYREYLGEYYHILKRPEEAQATWKEIASGERRTAINVARLAEVYNSFGYLEQAVSEIAAACELDGKDFALHLKSAEYHNRAGKYDDALTFVHRAAELGASDEEQAEALNQRIEIFQSSRRLEEETDQLASQLDDDASVEQWHTLARYYEADRRWADATEAVAKALQQNPSSILALTTSARIAELSGDYAAAAEMNRRLAAVDRRSRSDHLMNVARLEAQLGKADEALQAGKDLIVSAPGNTDNYEFYAQLCFQLGKMEEGLDALRKAVRINPTEPALIMSLGSALSQEFRTDEAIEVYWRAFEKTEEIDDKTSLTQKLTELYLQLNQFDKLVERFERDRREDAKRREMTICLAQAHHSAGDFGTARMELESLLSENTRDTNLLQQLSKLCEQESDLDGAIDYQRQLTSAAPGHETEFRLAGLLQRRGDHDEASDIFVRLTQREEDPGRLLRSLDSLLRQSSYESVIAVTEPLLSETRDDWELIYREGVAWALLEKTEEAKDRFQRLLALTVPHDKLGRKAEEEFKRQQTRAKSNNLRGIRTAMPQLRSPLTMLSSSYEVRRAVGLDADNRYYGAGSVPNVWTPGAYGVARMAAFGWLMKFEQDAERKRTVDRARSTSDTEEVTQDGAEANDGDPDFEEASPTLVEQLAEKIQGGDPDRSAIYDYMYVQQLQNNMDEIFKIARRLAKDGGKEEKQYFLTSLASRHITSETANQSRSANEKPKKDPLGDEDLDLMMECFRSLNADKKDKSNPMTAGGQVIVSGGRVYVRIGNTYHPLDNSGYALGPVLEELKLGGREDEAERIWQEYLDEADTAGELVGAMNMLFSEERFDELMAVFQRWTDTAREEIFEPSPAAAAVMRRNRNQRVVPTMSAQNVLAQWMGKLGAEEENEQVLDIMDQTLDLVVKEGQHARATRLKQRRRRPTPTRPNSSYGYSTYYGTTRNYVRMDYPPPNDYVHAAGLLILRQAFETLNRNDVLEDLPKRLRQRLDAAKAANDDSMLYEQLLLGYVLWWSDEKEEAVELLTAAARQLPDDPSFRLEMGQLHQLLGDPDTALDIVESIAPRDQKLVQQRELMALQLSERLGDIDRARSAAERLFGLRLDTNTQLALVDQMRRLGMVEMAEAIVARVQRRSGNQLNSLPQLMTLYQGQGKIELAEQIAHTILRRSKSPLSIMTTSGRNPFRSNRNAADANRTQALRLLQQTGSLKELIARLEKQLERSPDSQRTYDQLIEYYQASNDRDKVQELLMTGVEHRPDSIAMRYQLAKHLEQSGKMSEACEQYLEVLRRKPSWIADDLYQVRRVFQRANRSVDLVKAFDQVNLKSLGHPYYVIDLVTEMLRGRGGDVSDENREIAITLFERVFDAFPSYRNNMVSQLRDAEMWKNPRIFELGKRGIIPSKSQASSNPWFGVDQIYSWSSGGRVNAMFHQILNGVAGTDRAKELRTEIEKGVEKLAQWHGGQAMLALIDFKENKRVEAKHRLEKLLADESRIEAMPAYTGWIVGQELEGFEDTRNIALKLFEHAAKQNREQSLSYSPIVKLIDMYEKAGRKEEARELMLKQTKRTNNEGYNDDYYQSITIGNTVWVAKKLLDMGYPVDSVKLFRKVLDAPKEVLERAQNYGYANNASGQAKKGLEDALAALNTDNAAEAMQELLTVPEDAKQGESLLDLMLRVPTVQTLQTESMDSQLMSLLKSISSQDSLADDVVERLETLRQGHPTDVSLALTKALFAIEKQRDSLEDDLKMLLAVVSDNPLDEIAEGRRPNARQRRQARQHVPLWLVARECLESEDHRELGERLGELAIAGARRQLDQKEAAAILYDWGKRSIELGDRESAEAKWSELLDLVTKRPERKKKPSSRSAGGRPGTAPVAPPVNRSGASPIGRRHLSLETLWSQFAQLHPVVVFSGQVAIPATPVRANPNPSVPTAQPTSRRRIPPLTLSQFRTTIEIALVAGKNDMPALSRKAIKKSLEGGLPVPDATNPASGSTSGLFSTPARTTTVRSSSSSDGQAVNPIESEVANSLRKVLSIWETKSGYPAAGVYELLHPIVLPESRPAEILMYADSSQLKEAQTKSLGFALVRWAKKAQSLDDLLTRIDARKDQAPAKVPALVLQSQIAVLSKDFETANERLLALNQAIRDQPMQPMIQLACHAAIPAADHETLEANAFKILQFSVKQQYSQPDRSGNVSLGKLVSMVNRFLAKTGDSNAIGDFFDAYLMSRQSYYSRYSGDYGNYRQQLDIANMAEEAAKTGATETALDFMGRVVDVELTNYGKPSVRTSLAMTAKQFSQLPAKERYEAWRHWTMPAQGRQTIRFVADFAPPVDAPDAFLDSDARAWKSLRKHFLCNLTEMVLAAEESGSLAEMIELAEKAKKDKLDHADVLLPIALIYDGKVDVAKPLVEELIATIDKRNEAQAGRRRDILPDYTLFRTCMEHSSESAQLYREGRHKFYQVAKSVANRRVVANLPADFAKREAIDRGLDLPIGGDTGLKYWFGGATHGEIADDVKSWWAAQEDVLFHVSGPTDMDFLHFAYPLTGNFAFELDAYEGDWAETDAGYAGVYVESQAYGSRMRLKSLAAHETVYRPKPYLRNREAWGSIKVETNDGKLRYWLNNYIVHEETIGHTSPFFVLFTEGPRLTAYKNIRLTGDPIIPREVRLIGEASMDGWNTQFASESQPRRRLLAEPATSGQNNDYNAYYKGQEPAEYDWDVKKGILTAMAKPDRPATSQSWAYYHRPLRHNETFRYEFHYSPESTVAHPTFGRVALLLRKDGVASHWIARQGWDEAMVGVTLDNEIVEAACQRSHELPLKENDWNAVEMKFANGTLQVSLNGDLIFERQVTDQSDLRFGFYRRQQQSLKVRNAVLTGEWPETVTAEIRNNLLALSKPIPSETMHAIQRLATDKYFVADIRSVMAKADLLGETDKTAEYEFLKSWVLPSDKHETIRLNFQLPQRSNATNPADRTEFLCPATRTLEVAAELNTLDELARVVDALPTNEVATDRHKQAMQLLLALQQGEGEKANKLLGEAYKRCVAGLPDYLEARDREVELILASQAAKHPRTQLAANDLARLLLDQQRKKATTDDFRRLTETMLGDTARGLAGPTTQDQLSQWQPVIYDKPESRGRGLRPSTWRYRRGSLQHFPGETWTQLFFQSPLQGKFEIHAERSTHGYQETHISYGGHAAEPEHDQSSVTVTKLMHNAQNTGGAVEIPNWSDRMSDFRIAVNENKITTFVNGVQIHEEQMKSSADPWIVLQTDSAPLFGTVNNLRITGKPVIPDAIRLLEVHGMAGWRADVYGESFRANGEGNENAPWSLAGEELQASIRTDRTGKNRESLMMYQRPMLEDGEIEFEAYYVPGAVEVHPAVGRSAFLIGDDGVQLHQLTDGEWEYHHTWTPDNAITLSSDSIELKENDWNQYRLILVGDKLSILVNGQVVCDHKLEERPNERFFGLFRYSDQTKSRVRNIVYRGDWPKELPPVSRQELAYPPGGPMQLAAVDSTKEFAFSSLDEAEANGLRPLGPTDSITAAQGGLRIQLRKAEGHREWTGLRFGERVEGNFEGIVDFRDLQITPNKDGWGVGFALHARTEDGSMVEVSISLNDRTEPIAKSVWQYKLPSGQVHTDVQVRSKEFMSGRLKLVRDGGSMHCMIAPVEGDFHLLRTFAIGNSPVQEIAIQNKCSDNVGEIDVVVSKISLSRQKKATGNEISISESIDRESLAAVE